MNNILIDEQINDIINKIYLIDSAEIYLAEIYLDKIISEVVEKINPQQRWKQYYHHKDEIYKTYFVNDGDWCYVHHEIWKELRTYLLDDNQIKNLVSKKLKAKFHTKIGRVFYRKERL